MALGSADREILKRREKEQKRNKESTLCVTGRNFTAHRSSMPAFARCQVNRGANRG